MPPGQIAPDYEKIRVPAPSGDSGGAGAFVNVRRMDGVSPPIGQQEVPMIGKFARTFILVAAFAAPVIAPASFASAATRFDGAWSVLIITQAGPCDQSYRFRGQIVNGNLAYDGVGMINMSGRVAPSGAIVVTVSSGQNRAVGSGRLAISTGGGKWRGQGPSGVCSGVWSAQRA
jgi:hypothetical protein